MFFLRQKQFLKLYMTSSEDQQHSNKILQQQISSLEREVSDLRSSLKSVTIERDALEVELQQLHDTVQTLEEHPIYQNDEDFYSQE